MWEERKATHVREKHVVEKNMSHVWYKPHVRAVQVYTVGCTSL
jgi:hypothetical protein